MYNPNIDIVKFIVDGYNNYKGDNIGRKIKNDGDAKCAVGMILYNNGRQVYAPKGKTGGGIGHAEMSALHNMIEYCEGQGVSHEQFASNIIDGTFEIEVGCEEKSCCVQCSVTLGHFKASAFDFDTVKCKKTMKGGGAWGMSGKVKAVLHHIVMLNNDGQKLKQDDLNYFCRASQSDFDRIL